MFADDIRRFCQSHGPDKPNDSERHSGSPKRHYGLSNPTMRNFVKSWKARHSGLGYREWEETLSRLYAGDSIDECCIAGMLLGQFPRFRRELPLPVLDTWIAGLRGWREIDTTCQSNFTADELLLSWNDWNRFLEVFSQKESISHRRASLVLMVKPLRDSDDSRLLERALKNVDALKSEKDILISKAVSWVLRSAIKNHTSAAQGYVASNAETLPPIAVREFRRKLETGIK